MENYGVNNNLHVLKLKVNISNTPVDGFLTLTQFTLSLEPNSSSFNESDEPEKKINEPEKFVTFIHIFIKDMFNKPMPEKEWLLVFVVWKRLF